MKDFRPDKEWMDWFMEEVYDPNHKPPPPPEDYGTIPGDTWFTGMTHTPEVRQRISAKQKVNMIGNKNALGPHQYSEESLDRCRKTGASNGRARTVIADGKTYSTIAEAAQAYGINRDTVGSRVKNPNFDWSYI
jgi:hypothetical protein